MEVRETCEASPQPLPEIGLLPVGGAIATLALAACSSGQDDPFLNQPSGTAVSSSGTSASNDGSFVSSDGTPVSSDATPANGTVISDPEASYAAAKAPEPDPRRACRFLQHASMGATEEDLARAMTLGFDAWLEEQRFKSGNGSRWQFMDSHGANDYNLRHMTETVDSALWYKLITSPDTLRQRVTLALSEIFVINPTGLSNAGEWASYGAAEYVDGLEKRAFGNYRDLLEYITLCLPMGFFLSLSNSKKADDSGRKPDENYAREIMQLFSIGLYELNPDGTVRRSADGGAIPTYTLDDVTGIARALTGWQRTGEANSFDKWQLPLKHHAPDHEQGEKVFLGKSIPAGTDGPTSLKFTLDLIANHANVGPFLGRQLIQRLVTSNPSAAYVQRVAAAWADNGEGVRGDLFAVIRAILIDPEATDDVTLTIDDFGKVREPILRFAQWARTFGASDNSNQYDIPDLSDPANHLGQSPLRSPSVFNFFRPGFVPPNTPLATRGRVAPELQISSEATIASYVNFMTEVIADGAFGVRANYYREEALAGDPAALVARINLMLTADQLTAPALALITQTIAAMPASSGSDRLARVHAAILLTMASPDYLVQK